MGDEKRTSLRGSVHNFISADFKTLLQIFYTTFFICQPSKEEQTILFSIVSLSSAVKQFQQLNI